MRNEGEREHPGTTAADEKPITWIADHPMPRLRKVARQDEDILAELKERKRPQQAKLLFFAGCVARQSRTEIIPAALQVLEKLGIDYAFDIQAEPCCGAPLADLGYFNIGKIAAEKVQAYVKASNCQQVLTACPQCAYFPGDTNGKVWRRPARAGTVHG